MTKLNFFGKSSTGASSRQTSPSATSTSASTSTQAPSPSADTFVPEPSRPSASQAASLAAPESPKVSQRELQQERAGHATTRSELHALKEQFSHLKTKTEASAKDASAIYRKAQTDTQKAQAEAHTARTELKEMSQELARTQASHAAQMRESQAKHHADLASKANEVTSVMHNLRLTHQLRDDQSNLFTYTFSRPNLTHPGVPLRGSMPRIYLCREPESLLAVQFGGAFEYAKDESGAAVLNGNPENWNHIVDYLAFDYVPKNPPESLVYEARYWNLAGMVERLEPAPVPKSHPDSMCIHTTDYYLRNFSSAAPIRFVLDAGFLNFLPRLQNESVEMRFDSYGLDFHVSAKKSGISVRNDNAYALSIDFLLNSDRFKTALFTENQHLAAGEQVETPWSKLINPSPLGLLTVTDARGCFELKVSIGVQSTASGY